MTRRWLQSADVEIDDASGALLVKIGDSGSDSSLTELASRLAPATSMAGGTKIVASAGIAEALVDGPTPCRSVWIGPLCIPEGMGINSMPVFLGDSNNQNMPLLPSSISGMVIDIDDASKIFVSVGFDGEGVAYRIFA